MEKKTGEIFEYINPVGDDSPIHNLQSTLYNYGPGEVDLEAYTKEIISRTLYFVIESCGGSFYGMHNQDDLQN